MENPYSIAIVIGNTNYENTSKVNYAINDAQLVKTYLINVLGYRSGNIVFNPDASKADIEGIFGTKENYKGRLFNLITENISLLLSDASIIILSEPLLIFDPMCALLHVKNNFKFLSAVEKNLLALKASMIDARVFCLASTARR